MTGMTIAARQSRTRQRQGQRSTPPGLPGTPSLGYVLFATRWLQAPLYFGLVVAQGVYVFQFFHELVPLVRSAVAGELEESDVMLTVLNLVDVVMIANLLIMVIVGGYETFVSRIGLAGHRDQPEWLSHVNSNVLKVKLATAIVGISSVHLLQMFVNIQHTTHEALVWGTLIHLAFILSALILAIMAHLIDKQDDDHLRLVAAHDAAAAGAVGASGSGAAESAEAGQPGEAHTAAATA